jgi:hypothetical protein
MAYLSGIHEEVYLGHWKCSVKANLTMLSSPRSCEVVGWLSMGRWPKEYVKRRTSNYTKKTSVFGLPKRANAKHLALGKDDEEKKDEDVELDGDLFLVGIEDDAEDDTCFCELLIFGH